MAVASVAYTNFKMRTQARLSIRGSLVNYSILKVADAKITTTDSTG